MSDFSLGGKDSDPRRGEGIGRYALVFALLLALGGLGGKFINDIHGGQQTDMIGNQSLSGVQGFNDLSTPIPPGFLSDLPTIVPATFG